VGDLRAELETISKTPRDLPSSTGIDTTSHHRLWKRALPLAITAIVFSIVAGIVGWTLKPSIPAPQVIRFPLTFADLNLASPRRIIALSPDNSSLVYLGANGQLMLRRFSEDEARSLSASIQGVEPFFSPDGQWVGFFSITERVLKKVAISGGPAITLCKSETAPYGVNWSEDGIVFGDTKGVMRVSADGGDPELIVPTKYTDEVAAKPQLLDHGHIVLFTVMPAEARQTSANLDQQSQIVAQVLPRGDRKVILRGGGDAQYLSSGHLIYTIGGNVLAVRFDPRTLEMKGGSVPVIEGVRRTTATNTTQLSVSDKGALIYLQGSAGAVSNTVLALADLSGKTQALPIPPAAYSNPRISPTDRNQLAVQMSDGTEQSILLYDARSNAVRRLTFGGNNTIPVWSQDGRYVYFRSDRDGKLGLFRQLADGTASGERLTTADESDARHFPLSVDPFGKILTFEFRRAPGDSDIWILPLDGDRKPRPLLVRPSFQSNAVFSPDGRYVAYMSNELVAFGPQIFVEPYPANGAKYQLSNEGGASPLWSPDGKHVFYYALSKINVVDVQTQPTFSFGTPSPLAITVIEQGIGSTRNYDITPDGKQLVVILPASQTQNNQSAVPQMNVVLNWVEELKQRVPDK